MSGFPASIDAVTPEWLTAILSRAGLLEGGRVVDFDAVPIGNGYTSSVYRLELDYDPARGAAPPSLVIKFHSESADTRALFEELRAYEREVRFYQTLARKQELPVPVCYAAEFDPASGDFVLLFEDLSAARLGSWQQDAVGDIRLALARLAELHAAFWGDPSLARSDWVVQVTDLERPPGNRDLWNRVSKEVKKLYPERLGSRTWSICDSWSGHWDEVMLCMAQDTHTLVHTDFYLEQMFFPTAELPRFVLFDWQYPSRCWGAEDAIHPIVNDLDIEVRRRHETELLNHYYDCLCAQGVTDLSRERFDFQCRLSLLWIFLMYFNVLAQPGMRQSLFAEIEADGGNLDEWIFEPLEAVSGDWDLEQALEQAISEGRGISRS